LSISGERTSDARATTTKGLIGKGPNWGLSFAITIENEETACLAVIDFQILSSSLFLPFSFYDSMNEGKLERWVPEEPENVPHSSTTRIGPLLIQ